MTTIDDHDVTTGDGPDDVQEQPQGSRRNMLKLAAGAAAGGAAIAIAGAKPAAALDNQSVLIGNQRTQGDTGRTTTVIRYTNGATPQVTTPLATLANANIMTVRDDPSGGGLILFNPSSSSYPAAFGGYGYDTMPNGIYGYTASPTQGYGIVGFGVNDNTGVLARGNRANVEFYNDGAAPPTRTDAHSRGEMIADDDGNLWYCTAAGSPGTWKKVAGNDTSGAFHAVSPYRGYDSRRDMPLPGVLAGGGQNRVISIKDSRDPSTGAIITPDVVPAGATAVAFTITVVNTVAAGNLTVTEGDAVSTTASTINWYESNAIVANSSVVKLDASRQVKVFNNTTNPGATTNFLLDITGYYL